MWLVTWGALLRPGWHSTRVRAFDAEEAMVLAAELFPERPRPSAAFLARPEHRGETDTMGLPPA